MKNIITVQGLSKTYKNRPVFENVSFSIIEGTFNTLIGCNGAGKSTILKLLSGIEKPDAGEVSYYGMNPFSLDFNRRQEIFYIHEDIQIQLNVKVAAFVNSYKEVFENWDDEYYHRCLRDRKIDINKKYQDLSRGQKMQIMMMMGLASRPKILFLDEITSVLDFDAQFYFLEELKIFVKQGGTVVITSNILSELDNYTDYLMLVQDKSMQLNDKLDHIHEKFHILQKVSTNPHPLDSRMARIKSRHSFENLIIVEAKLALELGEGFLPTNLKPTLEDILQLHFKWKQDTYETLVA